MRSAADATSSALNLVRFEIDSIDDQICDLLEKRFDAVERVRSVKSTIDQGSPIRPAREFAILSRLASRPDRLVSDGLKVRLWRVIMSASTARQAPVTIHVGASVGGSVPFRLLIQEHYASIPVKVHKSDSDALELVGTDASGLCIVALESPWAGDFLAGRAGQARVIGCLPLTPPPVVPELLILGHAEPEATGHDETIVIGDTKSVRASPNWQVMTGSHCVAAYPGFYTHVGDWFAEPSILRQSDVVRVVGQFSRLAGTRP